MPLVREALRFFLAGLAGVAALFVVLESPSWYKTVHQWIKRYL